MADFGVYSDESGISAGSPCYTIGVITLPLGFMDEFNDRIKTIYERSGMRGEIKWEKVRSSAGQVNLCIELLRMVLESPCKFHCIAVRKDVYRKWQNDEEEAFYTTYDFLLRQSCKGLKAQVMVWMDQKTTVYAKQDEVVQIITNHMLRKVNANSYVESVAMQDSKEHWGLQAVDILTGAVNSAYQLYLKPDTQMSKAKKEACRRMAQMLGFESLASDTMPNDDFNIWHFPPETRAKPKTEHVVPNLAVPLITREEYGNLPN